MIPTGEAAELSAKQAAPDAADVAPQREHVASADCWCEPTVEYVDPATGVRILVHKDFQ